MGADFCKQHPGQKAIGMCATCHIPVCEKCAVKAPKGKELFCCAEHASQFAAFAGVSSKNVKQVKRPSIFFAAIKWAIAAIIILAALKFFKVPLGPIDSMLPF